ncbi:DUF4279 domain-containing protein [Oharaeibacter diazotrophicus]|uniref:Uncharacterized protein DUF4279 n=1 Tax=Oharaeibacter diazotrophicus TaxID=1920512 RepID=A0A4R6RAX4_9HYPH|nr:DUF4279 domain-containing protein [Oharaeibacter diazotrophicus]TDP83085.1 uncharacterized protein DUF4279 [Oharaeibacter diazotrophicus]BBE71916.1 hypothetical protein OHA_1_01501 [Pleomorphomonas sp. SM30]
MLALVITGFEADPSRITEILGVEPTYTSRAGEPSRTGRPHRKSQWRLSVDDRMDTYEDHERFLDILLSRISGRGARFATMREVVRPESVHIYGGLYVDTEFQNAIGLTVEQMATLVECRIEWGVDIFDRTSDTG